MEAKYCIILLLWLAAARLGECFVLPDVPASTNTNVEKPSEQEPEDTFTPGAAFPLASDSEVLQERRGKYVAANELIPPKIGGDTDNNISTIQERNESGDNGPSITALPNNYYGQLVSLSCFLCAAAVCFLELMRLLIKYVKRTIRHRIYHLPAAPNNIEMSAVRNQ